MKYASFVAMLFVLVLAGSAVWASCATCAPQVPPTYGVPIGAGPSCPAPVATCPVCPAPVAQCPTPVATACPSCGPAPTAQQPACEANPCNACCQVAIPGAVGAGPAPALAGLQCPDFDPAYAQKIIEQNNKIIAVTEAGMQQACDRNLRNISGDIRARLISANNKIAERYGIPCPPPTGAGPAQAIIAGLGCGECVDMAYAKTLSELVKQSQAADSLAASQAVDVTLNRQGRFMADKEADWAFRLDRWVTAHGCCPAV